MSCRQKISLQRLEKIERADSPQFLRNLSEVCRNDWSSVIFQKFGAGGNINKEMWNNVFKYTDIYLLS